jgi:hypothetical protein
MAVSAELKKFPESKSILMRYSRHDYKEERGPQNNAQAKSAVDVGFGD